MRQLPLHLRIFIGLLLGATTGVAANLLWGKSSSLLWLTTHLTEPFGRLFLRLIFMVVLPLIFSALTLGVAGLGDLRSLGRVGIKTFVYTLCVTAASVAIGLVLVNIFRPGEGLAPEVKQDLTAMLQGGGTSAASVRESDIAVGIETLVNIVPDNPLHAAAQGNMLAVMFFSLMVGIGMALSPRERVDPLQKVLEGLYEVVMKIIDLAMRIAPYGVAALLFTLTARFGFAILRQLMAYVGVVLLGLFLHQFLTYSLLVKLLAKVSPLFFFRQMTEVMVVAFSTSSSNVTLPTALRVTQEKLGVPRDISGFVLTLGSTANQNGTALFEGVTVLFLAQFFGVHLSLGAQALVVLMAVLAGIGTAGVPGGSLPMIVPVLRAVGIPGEGIGIIMGVDRLLDMCRTVLNVTGDVTAALYVTRSEGKLRPLEKNY